MRELNVNEIQDVDGGIYPILVAVVIGVMIVDNIAAGWNEAHENCGC